ncbi:hypothetical protein FN846DRAFT_909975 [Sphaerosporella brunnea]|uniref:Uncharacterized protein n=1 Tax=Sphaerosporella brunnea TaxID=1250544 RepID=A0A5J5EPL6_9PEZI|nr:hypothetical protein FN846DRAFT_909975 [Sphaerosporella brunnea]
MPELAASKLASYLHQQRAEQANDLYVYSKLVPLVAAGSAAVSTVANLSAAMEEEEKEQEDQDDAEANTGAAEEESGGQRENEYLEKHIASLSVPPNPEGSPETEIPTVRDQSWPRRSGRQAQIQLPKSGEVLKAAGDPDVVVNRGTQESQT